MLDIVEHAEGCLLPVKAQAGACKNALAGEHGGALKVAVTIAPQKGRANDAIIELLAETLEIPKRQIELVAGPASPTKRFLLRGMSPAEALAKLSMALD